MTSVSVSIIIANYNREHYLSEAIESVLTQTFHDFELIIWDDGSTDQSVAIAKSYANQDSRVRVVEASHQGVVKSSQGAAKIAQGLYIGWLDSDDYLAPTALAETVTILDGQPDVGVAYTDYQVIDRDGEITGYGTRCQIPYSKDGLLRKFMTFHFRLIRKSALEQAGGITFNLPYAYDYDLCLKLSEITKFQQIKKPLYFYRSHKGNISHQKRIEQRSCAWLANLEAKRRRGLLDGSLTIPGLPKPSWLTNGSVTKSFLKSATCTIALLPLITTVFTVNAPKAIAQSITPADDGTGTQVNQTGNQFDITGGSFSGDNSNLFHSFEQLGLDTNQIANFLADPQLQNIIGRVIGGDPSVIDGIIQVTGGNVNLYLMNPAGVVFGENAQLNVPGSFTATTADGIRFNGGWFSATGSFDPATLAGEPNAFAFSLSQPGAVINAGNLTVNSGESLNLLGGITINTGELTAPAGQILVLSVPGEQFVRLSMPGNLLNFEIQPLSSAATLPDDWTLPVASLPGLLTTGSAGLDLGLSVNSDGSVQLTTEDVAIPNEPGTSVIAGQLDISDIAGQLDISDADGGDIHVFGDQISVVNARLNARTQTSEKTSTAVFQSTDGITIFDVGTQTSFDNFSISFRADNDITIEDVEDNQLNFGSANTTLTANADKEGSGSFIMLDRESDIIRSSGADISIGGDTISTGDITTDDGFPDGGNVTLTGNTISTGNIITDGFSSSTNNDVAMGGDITITGNLVNIGNIDASAFTDVYGEDAVAGKIEVHGESVVTGDIDSSSSITYNYNISGTTDLAATSGGINITGNSVVTGNIDSSSAIRASSGVLNSTATGGPISIVGNSLEIENIDSFSNVEFEEAPASEFGASSIGGTIKLSGSTQITLNASNTIDPVNIRTTSNNVTFDGPVTISDDVTVNIDGVGGTITFTNEINGSEPNTHALNLDNQDNLIVLNGIGTQTTLESFSIGGDGTGPVQMAGDFIFIGQQDFNNPLTLTDSTSISAEDRLEINNTLNADIHDLSLTSDEINFGDADNVISSNSSQLTLQASVFNRVIELGGIETTEILPDEGGGIPIDSSPDTLNITETELSQLEGFSLVTVGRENGAETITVIDTTDLSSESFDMTLQGENVDLANRLTLRDGATATLNTDTVTGGTDVIDLDVGTNGSLILNTTGSVGASDNPLSTTTGTLTNESIGGNLFIQNSDALVLQESSISGDLGVTTTIGDITDNGTVTVAGNSSFTTNQTNADITIDQLVSGGSVSVNTTGTDGNVSLTSTNAVNLNNSNVGGDLTIETTSGWITDSEDVTIIGDVSLTTNETDASIQLDQLDATGSISVNTTGSEGDVQLTNANAITLEQSTVGGDLQATTTTGDITDNGTVTVAGNSSFTTNQTDADITIDQLVSDGSVSVNTTGTDGNVSLASTNAVNLDNSNVGGDLTIETTSGWITDSENVTIIGNVNLTTNETDANIQLDQLDATGSISVNTIGSEGDVQLTNANAITLEQSTVGGDLQATTSTGDITDSNTVTIGGNAQFATSEDGADITLDQTNTSGTISLNTTGTDGNAQLTAETITLAPSSVGGTLNVTATQGDLTAQGTIRASQINGSSEQGNIQAPTANFVTSGQDNGGDIVLSSPGDLITGNLDASGGSDGGDINLTSGGVITTDNVDTSSSDGTGGNIALNSPGDLIIGNLDASGDSDGGNINVASDGVITSGNFDTSSSAETGGNITISSLTDVTTGNLTTSGSSNSGEVNVASGGVITSGNFDTSSSNGSGGDITLASPSDITTGNLNALGGSDGGEVNLTSDSVITTGDINTSGEQDGGDINLQATTSITTRGIDSSGDSGRGGDVSLDPLEDIEVEFIDARGGTIGGTVDITTERYFRATGVIPGTADSISTTGAQGGGAITIRHGGGGVIPFSVGDASRNGTAGGVTSGDATLAPDDYFFTHFEPPNIQVISVPAPEEEAGRTTPAPEEEAGRTTQERNDREPNNPSFQAESLCAPIDVDVASIDEEYSREFEEYLGQSAGSGGQSLADTCDALGDIADISGVRPAIVYLNFVPIGVDLSITTNDNNESIVAAERTEQQELELILVIPDQPPIRHRVHNATQEQVLATVSAFQNDLLTPINRFVENESPVLMEDTSYVSEAEQLYDWIIAPLRSNLDKHEVQNLVFIADTGLRSLPYAALYDRENDEFLVEQYSTGLMPSLSLTDTRLVNLQDAEVLAMGRTDFSTEEDLGDLQAPSVEVDLLTNNTLWRGDSLINEDFTRENLINQRVSDRHGIVHLATHAKFEAGATKNSYIQLWDSKLRPEEIQGLGWNDPPVKLLVLSACETAVGDPSAELGFAGFAAQAGVQSAMASLWSVDDAGTLAFMSEFYHQLDTAEIKAEALRRAQIAMLRGEVTYESGQLRLPDLDIEIPLRITNSIGSPDLSHPYYWSAFTMIGNPW